MNGLIKPGSEVLQNAFLQKEGPDRNKKGWEVYWKSVLHL